MIRAMFRAFRVGARLETVTGSPEPTVFANRTAFRVRAAAKRIGQRVENATRAIELTLLYARRR